MTRLGSAIQRFRALYGAGPFHLIGVLAALGFAGYLVWTVIPAPNALRIVVWVGAAAVLHDLVLWPLYTLADRALVRAARMTGRAAQARGSRPVPWINHVRVPAVLSAITLTISFPLVFRHSESAYHTASGLSEHVYLGRWLALAGAAFGVSGALYAGRLLVAARRRARRRPSRPDPAGPTRP